MAFDEHEGEATTGGGTDKPKAGTGKGTAGKRKLLTMMVQRFHEGFVKCGTSPEAALELISDDAECELAFLRQEVSLRQEFGDEVVHAALSAGVD